MEDRKNFRQGCLLGLAVGDAMGYGVDRLSWEEISRDYGPEGIRGYDLVNGYADVTSHTQITVAAACGLLVGLTRRQRLGRTAPWVRYGELALREWSRCQQERRPPTKTVCWTTQAEELRRRRCLDTRMLDTLSRDRLGTPREPVNSYDTPGSLGAAVAVGAFFAPERMEVPEVGKLGQAMVALSHGDPMTFLSGAVIAYAVAGILQDPDTALREQFLQATDVVAGQFGRAFPQAEDVKKLLHRAVMLASNKVLPPRDALEHLGCRTAAECVAGAMYVALAHPEDFDGAMVLAVNHSGHSAAVAALTGAFLGARLGAEAIPDFYLEGLECMAVLSELARDLDEGCPVGVAGFFDDTWDQKYIQGRRVDPAGWAEE